MIGRVVYTYQFSALIKSNPIYQITPTYSLRSVEFRRSVTFRNGAQPLTETIESKTIDLLAAQQLG